MKIIQQDILAANLDWLKARWAISETLHADFLAAIADREEKAKKGHGKATRDVANVIFYDLKNKIKAYPKWYFDPASDRQLERIAADGFQLSNPGIFKGWASDIIGLLLPAEKDDSRILRFFDIPDTLINQTRAPIEVARLLSDPVTLAAWKERPASRLLRESLRFLGMKIPAKLTHRQATELLAENERVLLANGSDLPEQLGHFQTILWELTEGNACEEFGIKKPSMTEILKAIEIGCAEGKTYESMAKNIWLIPLEFN